MKRPEVFRNMMGAFSDAAVLFPLLILLSQTAGFSSTTALLTTGLAYIVAAWIFRVPMSVQPLKSIAIASLAVGATFTEVRVSALLLGLVCVAVSFLDVDRISRKVPESIIHQLQVGLGVLLVLQGFHHGFGFGVLALAALMVLLPEVRGVPLLGFIATGGFLYAVFQPGLASDSLSNLSYSAVRPGLILMLLIPQLVLTSANSVLATRNVCRRYFGEERASRVTLRKLLLLIGLGNIAVSAVGGMPFCHGSGGVTAHFRGGSNRAWSTALMGVVLVGLAAVQFFYGGAVIIYPPFLIASLLVATGFFHLKLAAPTVYARFGWMKLGSAAILTLVTRNLIWVLVLAVLLEVMSTRFAGKEVEA